MPPEQNDAVLPEEDLDDDDETLEDEEEEEEEEDDDDVLGEPDEDEEAEPSPSTSSALTIAVPCSVVSNASTPTVVAEPKRQRSEQMEEKKALEDSRRLFQRLWTDEDEIGLLQGFLEYTSQRGSSHHNDTALFYDQIKSKLQLGFNKNQLVEKLRRLKKKYRNVLNKIGSGKEFSFKSPHDQATFEISRKIWSNTPPITGPVEDDDEINLNPNPNPNLNFNPTTSLKNEAMIEKKTPPSRKRSRSRLGERRELNLNDGPALNKDNDYYNHNCISDNNTTNNNNDHNCNGRHSVHGLIEETVRSCLTPVLKELTSSAIGNGPFGFGGRGFGVGGFALNHAPLSLLGLGSGEMVRDDKWRKQQILELEVYSRRLELVQDEIKVALEELRSAGAGGG